MTNNQDNGPVIIAASINLRNILDVGERQQLISLETTLRLYWKVGWELEINNDRGSPGHPDHGQVGIPGQRGQHRLLPHPPP